MRGFRGSAFDGRAPASHLLLYIRTKYLKRQCVLYLNIIGVREQVPLHSRTKHILKGKSRLHTSIHASRSRKKYITYIFLNELIAYLQVYHILICLKILYAFFTMVIYIIKVILHILSRQQ